MKTMLLVSLLALALGGCGMVQAKKDKFAAEQAQWVGKHVDDLVTKKGPPTSSYPLTNGGKVMEYSKHETHTSGGGSYTVYRSVYQNGQWVSVPQQQSVPVGTQNLSCNLIFRISPSNIVESWSQEGNSCY